MPLSETGDGAAARQQIGVDRRPVLLLLSVFLAGVVAGLAELVTDRHKTSTGASVAVANWVHVGLATALATALIAGYLRYRRKLLAIMVRPFTREGWASLLNGLVSVPLLIWELAMSASAQPARLTAAESWRARHVPGTEPRRDRRLPAARARGIVAGAPLGVLAFAAAVVLLFAVLRAGEQVFAAFDPDFTRDAWGGPSYLGASLVHWLDGVYILYACSLALSLALAAARRRRALIAEQA
ncbi:MAG: hypothetical protein ACM3ML_15030 [Micromonosporaceae bacterium]